MRPLPAFGKPVLIYNPTAGKLKRNHGRIVQQVLDALRSEANLEPELAPTTGPKTAGALAARHIREGADLIIALGGDGTVNEIAAGMVGSSTPLAVLPGGTANVFSIETRGGTNAVKAARGLRRRVLHRIAVGQLSVGENGGAQTRHFLAMTGAGLDASIVHQVNPRLKRSTGKFAYWVAGFRQFLRPLRRVMTSEGGPYGFVLASRVRNYGGDLEIARKASLLRDEFEVVTFSGTNPLIYALYFASVLVRLHTLIPGIHIQKATQVRFPEPGAYLQADGELVGMTPASIEILPNALTVLLPSEFQG